jgi:hypothetical protein
VIDFFAPPRDDFLLGGKHAYMSAARCLCNQLGDRKPICRYRHSQSSRCPAVQATFFAPFVRPTFPELRGAVRQHAFGWPALFPVRYLWCREGAVHGRRGRAPKTPTLLDVLGIRGD